MGRFDNFKFQVQEKKKLRVILDTDAACEADDPFAIVQALLTPRFHVRVLLRSFLLMRAAENLWIRATR